MFQKFPSKFIFWTEIENHDLFKQKYLTKIKSECELNRESYIVPNWDCEVYSSINHLNSFLYDEEFLNEIVWKPMDKMLQEAEFSAYPKSSQVSHIWFNVYEKGFFQETHVHTGENSSFSGIYIIELNEPNTTAFVVNDQIPYLSGKIRTNNIKEGSVIIFPSSLDHYVNPCKENRTTISFNISSEFN